MGKLSLPMLRGLSGQNPSILIKSSKIKFLEIVSKMQIFAKQGSRSSASGIRRQVTDGKIISTYLEKIEWSKTKIF